MRSFNLFSADAQDFLPSDDYDNGGWEVTSGSANLRTYKERGLYYKYTPSGSQYANGNLGSLLIIKSTGTSAITVASEFISVSGEVPYLFSAVAGAGENNRIAKMTIEYYSTTETSSIIARDSTKNKVISTSDFGSDVFRMVSNLSISPINANYAKMFITYTDVSETNTITDAEAFLLYDPVAVSLAVEETSAFGYSTYLSIPEFMRFDDDNIERLAEDIQPQNPLLKFMDGLTTRLALINNTLHTFRYVRATEGTEYLSKLTDPQTTEESNLAWLAILTGVNLYSLAVGSTPWLALQQIETSGNSTAGEWDDIELLQTWIGIQSANPNFYDIVQSFRDQIQTGFTGIHAGRPDIILQYMRTTLLSEAPEDVALTLTPRARDSAFRVTLLVDPLADPDPNGRFLTDILQLGLPVGVTGEKVNFVKDTADCNFDFDELFTSLTGDDGAGGAEVTFSMVSDSTGHGVNMLLNNGSPEDAPELGGEVGNSKYTDGAMYYSGYRSYWQSEEHAALDISQDPASTGYELIVELSDITEANAEAFRSETITPLTGPTNWQYRKKKLIACGAGPVVSGRISNDWALYMVSGSTLAEDPEVRLLWIDGYTDVTLMNWAVSEPINFTGLSSTSNTVLRIKYDGSFLYFYAQRGFFSNWESNAYGAISSSAFIPNMQVSSTEEGSILLGSSISLGTWADAEPISAGYRSVLLWKSPIEFYGAGTSTSESHAYSEGEPVDDFTVYNYSPNAFIDIWQQDNYVSTISFAVEDVPEDFTLFIESGGSVLDEDVPVVFRTDGGGTGGGGVYTPLSIPG